MIKLSKLYPFVCCFLSCLVFGYSGKHNKYWKVRAASKFVEDDVVSFHSGASAVDGFG